jgi:hypothetical protein
MAAKAKQGVTLRFAEEMRQCAWAKGTYIKGLDKGDWNRTTESWPASIHGACRHKCEWLKNALGGEILVGRRTDRKNASLHAVLWITIHGHEFVLDEDGTWPAKGFPFQRELWPPRGYWEGEP